MKKTTIYIAFLCTALLIFGCKNKQLLQERYPEQILGKWMIEKLIVEGKTFDMEALSEKPYIDFRSEGEMIYFMGAGEEKSAYKVEGNRILNPEKESDAVMVIQSFSRLNLVLSSEDGIEDPEKELTIFLVKNK